MNIVFVVRKVIGGSGSKSASSFIIQSSGSEVLDSAEHSFPFSFFTLIAGKRLTKLTEITEVEVMAMTVHSVCHFVTILMDKDSIPWANHLQLVKLREEMIK
jgi:hypothetical protein